MLHANQHDAGVPHKVSPNGSHQTACLVQGGENAETQHKGNDNSTKASLDTPSYLYLTDKVFRVFCGSVRHENSGL